jgi:protein disulfide-isomerase A6
MKPAWDELASEFEGRTDVIIADVDCTKDESKDLCSKYGVKGYPTIKYFTGSTDPMGDKYEGGRDVAALKAFAADNLGPSCSYANIDLCNDEQKADIQKYVDMSADEREALAKELETKSEGAETTFKDEVAKLQKNYEGLMKAKDDTIAEVSGPLRVVRGVINDLAKAAAKDEL